MFVSAGYRRPSPETALPDLRPAPFFIADDPALDFLNSIASPASTPVEWIADGRDLLDWMVAAGLLPAEVAARYRAEAVLDELDSVAARARALREWFRSLMAAHAGKPAEPALAAEIEPLNRLLRRDIRHREIGLAETVAGAEAGQGVLHWRDIRQFAAPDSLLAPLAEVMGDLLCRRDLTLVRPCEGVGCTLWFFDASKRHGRRWCSMAACGNRAKAAAHRNRHRPNLRCD